MKIPIDTIRKAASSLVESIAKGEYALAVRQNSASRLTEADLREIILQYGKKPVVPPESAYDSLDAVPIVAASAPTWSVRVPLWTEEEGRSDLTLEFTITLGQAGVIVELDDLHVL
jgi:hypothetical protein